MNQPQIQQIDPVTAARLAQVAEQTRRNRTMEYRLGIMDHLLTQIYGQLVADDLIRREQHLGAAAEQSAEDRSRFFELARVATREYGVLMEWFKVKEEEEEDDLVVALLQTPTILKAIQRLQEQHATFAAFQAADIARACLAVSKRYQQDNPDVAQSPQGTLGVAIQLLELALDQSNPEHHLLARLLGNNPAPQSVGDERID